MILAGDFRNGVTVQYENGVYVIIEFQHVKPGKGSPFVRTKLRNLRTGAVTEQSFRPSEKFENALIERKEMQYLYKDGDLCHFMDTTSYDQTTITEEKLGDAMKFVKENDLVKMLEHQGDIFGVEPPMFVELIITDTEPGVKGDTATGANKPAIVETGAKVLVPLFVNQGDKIKIDTRTGEYMSRA
ncbi:MAG TPA: elongation factor P [Clostridiales bacterium]|nr:MAG: elongation factor P [Clostridiales bacterium GWD2_32_59]HAN10188.1 elongation factor P [Clostridiales bacterium]